MSQSRRLAAILAADVAFVDEVLGVVVAADAGHIGALRQVVR